MSEYFGIVCKVEKLEKHPNADKLQILKLFGTQTIVGLDVKAGDIGIYFREGLQLSEEFCDYNHLCRTLPNGNKDIGYMERNKRNVKTVKLRGQYSDGIFCPLKSLEYTGVDLSSFTVGDKVEIVNGKIICCKYMPFHRPSAPQVKQIDKKKKLPLAPDFAKHVDTAQLCYNLDKFKCGDTIEISLKMHGCFIRGTKVRMADGSLKAIERIQVGDKVLGYSFEQKKIVPTTVLNTFKNAPSQNWNQLKFSRNGVLGDKRGTQTSTYNHKYWVEEKQEWVMAENLQVGDKISTLIPSPVLTSLQKEIMIGSFLGDGCLLSFRDQVAEIQESKKKEHIEYLQYLENITSNFFSISQEKTSGYGSEIIMGRTSRSADFYNYFRDISTFKNGDNDQRLKEGIINKITPLSLALWYCGDGSLAHWEQQQDRANIAICRYTQPEDRDIIKKIFAKFDLYPVFFQDSRLYWRLRFNLDDANKLFDLIAEYIPPCMQYKLPEQYQNRFIQPVDTEKFNPKGFVLSPQEVLENVKVTRLMDEYDLETELHNYVVGLTIVHNTSARTAHTKVLKGYKRSLLDRILRREGKPIYKLGYATGTRKTIINDFDNDSGFYGDNKFREPAARFFGDKLRPNEACYYELVGYTTSGAPIMPSAKNTDPDTIKQYGDVMEFSYGCSPNGKKLMYGRDEEGDIFAIEQEIPQCDFYIYRITQTLDDGTVIEYTGDQIRRRCAEWGCKCVPLLYREVIPNQAMLNLLSMDGHDFEPTPGGYVDWLVKKYYDGPDPIGKSHIREGVVVRIENRPGFEVYKVKNQTFKICAGIALDTADTSEMSEDQIAEL